MSAPTTQAPPSANDFLLGGGESKRKNRSVSFPQVGATITGTICEVPTTEQQRDADGKLKFWDNSTDPKWQIVVPLQTTLRSMEVEDDDGVRYLYVSGNKKPESRSLHAAVAEAAAGTGLELGGILTVTYVADGAKTKVTYNAPKQYTAAYVSAANNALLGGAPQQPAAAVTSTPAAAVTTTATLPYPAHMSPEQVAACQAAGLDPVQALAMFPAPAA